MAYSIHNGALIGLLYLKAPQISLVRRYACILTYDRYSARAFTALALGSAVGNASGPLTFHDIPVTYTVPPLRIALLFIADRRTVIT